jgi:peptidoglycan/LPS O-acetylase OafA/YrhL
METASATDRRVGLAALFGVLGLAGAFVMFVAALGDQQLLSGWGFAGAMLGATLLVAALHLYD